MFLCIDDWDLPKNFFFFFAVCFVKQHISHTIYMQIALFEYRNVLSGVIMSNIKYYNSQKRWQL